MDETTPTPQPERPTYSTKQPGKKARLPRALKVTAKVLHEMKVPQGQIAKELNVSLSSVQNAIADPSTDRSIVEKVKSRLSGKLYLVANKIAENLHSLSPEEIKRLPPYTQALILAILIDKARLLDGQSTENISIKSLGVEIQDKLHDLSALKARLVASIKGE